MKKEPLSELVCMGKKCTRVCVYVCASEHEKEVKRRNGSTRVRGSNYVCVISVNAGRRKCVCGGVAMHKCERH